jgi:hypothetical protein
MRVLVYSLFGDGGGLAYQMAREGAKVDLFIKDPYYRQDFILFDLSGDGKKADDLRRDGWKVIGSSDLADRLENDRAWAGKVAAQYGLYVPEATEFKDIESALAFVKKTKKPYALKVDNGSEASSYVAKDFEDMVGYLEQLKEEKGVKNGQTFILQSIVKGSEVSTELWCSDGVPLYPANSTWETKKLLAGELGVRTGCEVSLVTHYEGHSGHLLNATVGKLLPLLKYSRWTGPIDVNAIVDEETKRPYFLEFTPRIGYSAIYAFMAILGMPMSEFLYRVSRGTFTIPFKGAWGSSLKLHVPPYPVCYEDDPEINSALYAKAEGIRVNGEYGEDFIPIDCFSGKRTELEVAGSTCIVGECLGRGSTALDAWRGSQKVFKSVEVPNQGGRYTDGLSDCLERVVTLRKWGYDVPNPNQFTGARPSYTPLKTPAPV